MAGCAVGETDTVASGPDVCRLLPHQYRAIRREIGVFANGATWGTPRFALRLASVGTALVVPSLTREAAAYFVDVFFTPKSSASVALSRVPRNPGTPSVTTTSTPARRQRRRFSGLAPRRQLARRRQWLGATPTSTPTNTAAPSSAPSALNLPRIPWEGGPNYWKSSPSRPQVAKADAAGWDDPSFFPISVFLANPGDAAALKALGSTYLWV